MRTTRRINLQHLETLDFSKGRKGYDADEVKGALASIATQVRTLIDERDRLAADLRRSEQKVEDLLSRPAPVPERSELTRLLGDEMVKLLDSARSTADEIVDGAHAEADSIRDSAHQEADARVGDADAAIARRRAEAAEEEREILERAQQVLVDHKAQVEASRAELEVQIDEEFASAKQASKAQLDAAREEGREMIVEARQFRETILRDLAGRRKIARKQLEAMRAAQERLLEAFTSCAMAVESATSELHTALPAAKAAADLAADRVNDDIEQVVSQLESAIHTGELPALVLQGVPQPKLRSNALPATSRPAADPVSASDLVEIPASAEELSPAETRALSEEGDSPTVDGFTDERLATGELAAVDLVGDLASGDLADADLAESGPAVDPGPIVDAYQDAIDTIPEDLGDEVVAPESVGGDVDDGSSSAGPESRPRFDVIQGEAEDEDFDDEYDPEGYFEEYEFDEDDAENDEVAANRPSLTLVSSRQPSEAPPGSIVSDYTDIEFDPRGEVEHDEPSLSEASKASLESPELAPDPASSVVADDEPNDFSDVDVNGSEPAHAPTSDADYTAEASAERASTELTEEIADDAEPRSGDPVNGLFARLRADRDAAVTAAREVLASALTDSSEPPADAADMIDRRDDAVAAVERNVARRFKRVLDDEQNEVLDRIRRAKQLDPNTLLPNPEALAEAYLRASEEELEHAVALGATFLSDCGVSSVPIDAASIASKLATVIAAEMTEPWVDELAEILSTYSAEQPRGDVVTAVRTAYRYRKMDRLAELSGVVVVDAFNVGAAAAARPGDTLEWIEGHARAGESGATATELMVQHYAPVRGGEAEKVISIVVQGAVGPDCRCVLAPVDRS